MRTGRFMAAGVVAAWLSPEARACSVCFGAPGSVETQAMNWAILFMLGVLACVLGSFALFMVHLARRDG